MESGFGRPTKQPSSSSLSSSQGLTLPSPPPASGGAIASPRMYGEVAGADRVYLRSRSVLDNYPLETLEAAFSDLALGGYGGRSLHNLDAASSSSSGGINVGPGPLTFFDRESSNFDASRSAFSQNLADHWYYPYSLANGAPNFAGSSSSSRSSYNLIPSAYGASRFYGNELLNRRMSDPLGFVDCTCPQHPTSTQFYHHHRNLSGRNFAASVPTSPGRYQNGLSDNAAGVRRHSRQKLDLESSSVDLMELKGNVAAWAKDQNGCRILQAKFQNPTEEEIEMVLSEVVDQASELMKHPFGNYLMQMLIDVCNEEQRSRLLVSVTEDSHQLRSICFDTHGTRAIQKLLEKLTSQQQISQFMLALGSGVVELIKDMNGHHVIQHCLKNFSSEQNKYLLAEVAANCFYIATDKSGCCVLQQCVAFSKGEAREHLLSEIITYALPLSEDQYGNYVVQHVLGLKNAQLNSRIVNQLQGSYIQLSCNKFASHVVEKCLTQTDATKSSLIIKELLQSPKVAVLLLDPYGNFVIQAALSVSQGSLQTALIRLIQANMSSMRTNMYGRKILEWFDRKGRQGSVV